MWICSGCGASSPSVPRQIIATIITLNTTGKWPAIFFYKLSFLRHLYSSFTRTRVTLVYLYLLICLKAATTVQNYCAVKDVLQWQWLHHKVSYTATKMRKHTSGCLVDFDTAGEIHPLAVTMLLYPTAVWFLLTVSPFDRELVLT